VTNDTWSETGITWNHQPATATVLASSTVTGPGWVTLDVTAFVNSQLAGDRKASFALRDTTLAHSLVRLRSREAATERPELVLVP
jgi:hypothetical protein